MSLTAYGVYVHHLYDVFGLERTSATARGSIQITLCRNASNFRRVEHFGPRRSKESWTGSVVADRWMRDENGLTDLEIERFFALPEFFAYSDKALQQPHPPIQTAHWDATVALIDATFEREGETLQQRMMFAGFSDPIHAEFFAASDRNLLVHDHDTGMQLFEWRPVTAKSHLSPFEALQLTLGDQGEHAPSTARSWIGSRIFPSAFRRHCAPTG